MNNKIIYVDFSHKQKYKKTKNNFVFFIILKVKQIFVPSKKLTKDKSKVINYKNIL